MGCQFLSSSCLLIKFTTPYIAGVPALFLWESPPYHHSIAGVPATYLFSFAGVPATFSFSLAGVPATYFFSFAGVPATFSFFSCRSPGHISISIAGVPAQLGLHSFQVHQFHPNLISKDEENNWSFTIIHISTFHHNFIRSSSQLNLIIIIFHNLLPCMEIIQPPQFIPQFI